MSVNNTSCTSVSGIIMAAGFSRRMTRDKLLLPLNGSPMVEHVVRAATASMLGETLIVYRDATVAGVGARYKLACVCNDHAAEGQSASIRLGVAAAGTDACAYMFLVGDQPFLTAGIIDRIIEAHARCPKSIIVPRYGAKRGTPTLFPADLRDELLTLQGDSGGRQIMDAMPERIREILIDDTRCGLDIDTPGTYRSITGS